MQLAKLKRISNELVYRYLDKDWKIEYSNRMTSAAGYCDYRHKTIKLSIPISKLHPDEKVINTILHEIAHALVGCGHGHDMIWREKAVEIGCDGKRCYGARMIPKKQHKHRYIYRCPKCNREITYHRKATKGTMCGRYWNYCVNPSKECSLELIKIETRGVDF